MRILLAAAYLLAVLSPLAGSFPFTTNFHSNSRLRGTGKDFVAEYFDGPGFERWRRIYSSFEDVNPVQAFIRKGHRRAIATVEEWLGEEGAESHRSAHALDAGCGVGQLTLPLCRLFRNVTACDLSASMVCEARRQALAAGLTNADFCIADFESLAPSEPYNFVACIDVLIHYPSAALPGMVRNLGKLARESMVLSYAPSSPLYCLLKRVGDWFPGQTKATPAYLHSRDEMDAALAGAGFRVVQTREISEMFYVSRLVKAVRVR